MILFATLALAEPPRQRMEKHFDASMALRAALVAGDLAAGQAAARSIAGLPAWTPPATGPGATPEDAAVWRAGYDAVRAAAGSAAQAPDLDALGARVGQLAAACAACHQDTQGGPRPAPDEIALYAPLVADHASRLDFASWFAWLGVVSPSDAAWSASLPALAALSGTPGGEAPARAALVARASVAPASERPALYGQVLATCGRCHAASAVHPGVSP